MNSLGLHLSEEWYAPETAINEFDKNKRRYMVGIILGENRNSKHAVIFDGKRNEKYRFLNPKRKDSLEPNYYEFTREELICKLPQDIVMGYLIKTKKVIPIDVSEQLLISLQNIDKYRNLLTEYCSKEQDINSLNRAKESLFAPLLLDVLSMMELIGETNLVNELKILRKKYLDAMKKNCSLLLSDYISLEYLDNVIFKYKDIIMNYISNKHG